MDCRPGPAPRRGRFFSRSSFSAAVNAVLRRRRSASSARISAVGFGVVAVEPALPSAEAVFLMAADGRRGRGSVLGPDERSGGVTVEAIDTRSLLAPTSKRRFGSLRLFEAVAGFLFSRRSWSGCSAARCFARSAARVTGAPQRMFSAVTRDAMALASRVHAGLRSGSNRRAAGQLLVLRSHRSAPQARQHCQGCGYQCRRPRRRRRCCGACRTCLRSRRGHRR